LALLTLGIIEGPTWGWDSARVAACWVAAIVALTGFVVSSQRHPSPILDGELLRIRSFAVANVLIIAAGAGFYAYLLTNILWLHEVWGYSVLRAGLALAPAAVIAAVVAGAFGGIADKYGARVVVIPGALVWSAAYIWYVTRVGTTPDFVGEWLPGQVLSGIGVGATLPVVTSAALASVPGGRFATGSAVISSTRQLGGVLGVSLLVAIIGAPTGTAVVGALRHGWLLSAVCFALVAAGALAFRPATGASMELIEEVDDTAGREAALVRPAMRPPEGSLAGTSIAPAPAEPQTLLDLLHHMPALANVDDDTLNAMGKGARTVGVRAGELLFDQGDKADAAYVVRSGVLEVVKDGQVVSTVSRGGVLGELGILTGSPRAAGVRARRDSELLRVTKRRFEATVSRSPSALRALASGLARQVQEASAVSRVEVKTRTVAVVPLDGLVPIAMIVDMLQRELNRDLRAARLSGADPGQLEAAERDNDLVLLQVESNSNGDAWRNAAIRQADRMLFVAASGTDPADLAPGTFPPLDESRRPDVLLLGPAPSREQLCRWHDALSPRTCVSAELSIASLAAAAGTYAARLAGRSVGLVLSGGGARAMSHLGVIEELASAGIRIDRVAGASMGSYIAALVASGQSPEEVEATVYGEFVRRTPVGDWGLPRTSLM
jgi:CRP-like cAMP-binding protein